MKTLLKTGRTLAWAGSLALALTAAPAGLLPAAACAAPAVGPATAPDAAPLVVGVFDSRAIAVAAIRSPRTDAYLGALHEHVGAAIEAARARGDEATAAALEAVGPALQDRFHAQGFSTAPVDDHLAAVADRLPAIAADAGADLLVSKWALTWSADDATFVDVTAALVDAFDPDEATRAAALGILEHEPVPVEELSTEH